MTTSNIGALAGWRPDPSRVKLTNLCDTCGRVLPNYGLARDCPSCGVAKAREGRRWLDAQQPGRWLAAAGVGELHKRCATWAALNGPEAYRTAVRRVQRFVGEDAGGMLLLHGTRGSGKTQCMCVAVLETINAARKPARYVTLAALAENLKARFGSDKAAGAEWVREWGTWPRLLAIDEIGAVPLGEHVAAMVTELIDTRYREKRPTLLGGNIDPADLGRVLGDNVAARLTEHGSGAVRFAGWASFRDGSL
jgi:DNA replication protein DnaC